MYQWTRIVELIHDEGKIYPVNERLRTHLSTRVIFQEGVQYETLSIRETKYTIWVDFCSRSIVGVK